MRGGGGRARFTVHRRGFRPEPGRRDRKRAPKIAKAQELQLTSKRGLSPSLAAKKRGRVERAIRYVDLNDYSVPHDRTQRSLTVLADLETVRIVEGHVPELATRRRRGHDAVGRTDTNNRPPAIGWER
jgi:hypothetical protein